MAITTHEVHALSVVNGNDRYDYIPPSDSSKADKSNPVITGSLSLGRKSGTTVGANSVAEGTNVTASGTNSAASGEQTIASGKNSSVSGQYNVGDSVPDLFDSGIEHYNAGALVTIVTMDGGGVVHNTVYRCKIDHDTTSSEDPEEDTTYWESLGEVFQYAEIVGNGSSDNSRSNARALDWSGNEYLNGDLRIRCDSDGSNGTSVGEALDELQGHFNSSGDFSVDGELRIYTEDPLLQNYDYTSDPPGLSLSEVFMHMANLSDHAYGWRTGDRQALRTGDDLNDCTAPGTYTCTGTDICASLHHRPSEINNGNFKMFTSWNVRDAETTELQRKARGTQVIIQSQYYIWMRYFNLSNSSNPFSDWFCVTPFVKEITIPSSALAKGQWKAVAYCTDASSQTGQAMSGRIGNMLDVTPSGGDTVVVLQLNTNDKRLWAYTVSDVVGNIKVRYTYNSEGTTS